MMSVTDQFNAAVEVIKNLPKDGPYQPSAEMKLKFYAYYKQATEGPCHTNKPGFWDVVNRTKWSAWNKLGNMPQNEAMENYIEELKMIVETMSFNDKVADFMNVLGPFYEIVENKSSSKADKSVNDSGFKDDSVLRCGEVLNENNNLIKSLSESLDMVEPVYDDYDVATESLQSCDSENKSSCHELYFSGSESVCDNLDIREDSPDLARGLITADELGILSKDGDSCYESADGGTPSSGQNEDHGMRLLSCELCPIDSPGRCHSPSASSTLMIRDMNTQVLRTLQRMQVDIHSLRSRLEDVESQSISHSVQMGTMAERMSLQLTPRMQGVVFGFLLVWPLVVNIVFSYYRKLKRR